MVFLPVTTCKWSINSGILTRELHSSSHVSRKFIFDRGVLSVHECPGSVHADHVNVEPAHNTTKTGKESSKLNASPLS